MSSSPWNTIASHPTIKKELIVAQPSRRLSRRILEQKIVQDAFFGTPRGCLPSHLPKIPTSYQWKGQEEDSLEELVVILKDNFSRMDQRTQVWGAKRASHFLRWWVSEMQRVVTEVIERGSVELEREDGLDLVRRPDPEDFQPDLGSPTLSEIEEHLSKYRTTK